MKVLVISHMYPSTFNKGSGIFVHKQVKALIKQGCDVEVICPMPWAPFPLNKLSQRWKRYSEVPMEDNIEGVKVYYPRYIEFPKGYLFHRSGYMMYKGIATLVENLHKKQGFDVIHCHVALPDGYSGILLSEKLKIPVVVTVHGQDVQNTIYRNESCKEAVFSVMDKAHGIITVSNKLRNIVKNEAFADKIQVINNGIDINDCKATEDLKAAKPKDSILLLSVANLNKSKGIDLNIKAVAKLMEKYPNLIYYIIGDGPERQSLEKLVYDNNLKEKVVFLGKLDYKQVMNYMAICDIFSLPSWREGFGVVYIEAMAHGKPVIGVKGEGIEDAIINGENGLLVEPKSVDSLVEAMNLLITNRDKASVMGLKGRETVVNGFTWEKNAEAMIKAYRELKIKN